MSASSVLGDGAATIARRTALLAVGAGTLWLVKRAFTGSKEGASTLPDDDALWTDEFPEDDGNDDLSILPDDDLLEESMSNQIFLETKFIGCVPTHLRKTLFTRLQVKHLKAGETLFRRGDPSDEGLALLIEGRLKVFIHDGTESVHTGNVYVPESVGDFDVVDGHSRSVTLVASQDSKLAILTRESFTSFVREHPITLLEYCTNPLARLWRVSDFALHEVLGLMPEHEDDVCDGTGMSETLKCLFQTHGETRHLPAGMSISMDGFAHLVMEGELTLNSGQIVSIGAFVGCGRMIAGVEAEWAKVGEDGATVIRFSVESLRDICNDFCQLGPEKSLAAEFADLLCKQTAWMCSLVRSFSQLGLIRHWRKAGELVYEADSNCDGAYVVAAGRVRRQKRIVERPSMLDPANASGRLNLDKSKSWTVGSQAWKYLGDASRGEVIGLRSLLEGRSHECTALCVRDAELVKLPIASLYRITKLDGQVPFRLAQSRNSDGKESMHTVCVLPCQRNADMRPFVAGLNKALKNEGNVSVVTFSSLKKTLGVAVATNLHTSFARAQVSAWLSKKEEGTRFVVLVASDNSAWSRLCVAQADVVLLVADANASPVVSGRESTLVDGTPHASVELVLLHKPINRMPAELPRGTRRWLAGRPRVVAHHHLRTNLQSDYDRLGRRLAGTSVGLVLSGGGSRGLAHMGVIKALEEEGIPVDYIGGTSQGAFMGAAFALSGQSKGMEPRARKLASKIGSISTLIKDLTLPILSIFSGAGMNDAVRSSLGNDVCIEDLWLPYFCISTNLSSMSEEVHRHGQLWPAVRASMTVVQFLPPMWRNGDLLCDGGYIDNLPILQMKAMNVHTLIAVDVENRDNSALEQAYPYSRLSGFRLFAEKFVFWRAKRRFPKYDDIVSALTYISHTRQIRAALTDANVDLYLRPPVQKFQLLDYDKMDEIVGRSYRYAKAALQEWQREDGVPSASRSHSSGVSRSKSLRIGVGSDEGAELGTPFQPESRVGSATLRSRSMHSLHT